MKLSHSQMAVKQRCDRMYRYQYTDGYVPAVTAPALEFGTAVHTALESYWSRQQLTLSTSLDEVTRARVLSLYLGYHDRWSSADRAYHVLGVEMPFELDLGEFADGEPLQFVGKMDVVVEDLSDGFVFVVEHKTTGADISPGAPYWDRLRLDSQIGCYALAVRELLGRECVGVIYDVIRRPPERILATPEGSRRYKKDGGLYANQRADDEPIEEFEQRCRNELLDNPAMYFRRVTELRLEAELTEQRQRIIDVARQIRFARSEECYPMNPGSCHLYNRPCDFYEVCAGTESLQNRMRFRRKDEVLPPHAMEIHQ